MSGIKGIVLAGRLGFIEENHGKEGLKSFLDKLKVDKESPLFQPIQISKDYPEELLTRIDHVLEREYLSGDGQKFLELGQWTARHMMPTYFQIYIDEQNPGGFLEQLIKLRPYLIGLGEMAISALSEREYYLRIHYGQTYPESVRLSELGFIEQGLRLCGAKDVQATVEEKDEVSVEYKFSWK